MELNRRTILIAVVSIVVIFGLLYGVYVISNKPETSTATVAPETNKIRPADHITWSKDKKVILAEYGDLQCPACRNFHDVLKGMEKSPQDKDIVSKITLVYRHYPLQQVHKNALGAAYLAEAAAKQNKFFEYVDSMYDNQDKWGESDNPQPTLLQLAKDMQLDTNRLKADSQSDGVKNAVSEDIASGNSAGVDSTPSFYLQGKKMTISTIEDFKNQLRAAATGK